MHRDIWVKNLGADIISYVFCICTKKKYVIFTGAVFFCVAIMDVLSYVSKNDHVVIYVY